MSCVPVHLYDRNLVQEFTSPEDDNNKKGMMLAVLVIVFILAAVALNIVIFSEPDKGDVDTGERLNVAHLLNSSFEVNFNMSWLSGQYVWKFIKTFTLVIFLRL